MRKEYSKYIIVNENLLTLLQNSRMESLWAVKASIFDTISCGHSMQAPVLGNGLTSMQKF